ncbi:hypothetical protein BKA70DRAFT_1566746, partial [Coprinopsis sp. MPI-PUGE-AT-0042]
MDETSWFDTLLTLVSFHHDDFQATRPHTLQCLDSIEPRLPMPFVPMIAGQSLWNNLSENGTVPAMRNASFAFTTSSLTLHVHLAQFLHPTKHSPSLFSQPHSACRSRFAYYDITALYLEVQLEGRAIQKTICSVQRIPPSALT